MPEHSRRLWIYRRAWSATGLRRRRTCHCPGRAGSTWPASPGTADKTTWTYHEASGLLTAKTDNAGKSVTYTYGTDGKLATRTWSRTVAGVGDPGPLTTTYSYSSAGDLAGIDYSDSTPDVSFTYDRLGRQITADSSVSAHTFAYDGLFLDTETIIRGTTTNVIDRSHDTFGRPTGFTLGADYSIGYGYDTYGRFSSVSSSVPSVSSVVQYSYLPASDLLSGYSESASGLTVSRTYEDNRNLLTQINNSVDSTTLSQYAYGNDAGGRRTSVKHSGTAFDVGPAFNAYGYNARSEVSSAARYWGADLGDTSEPVDGQAYAYAYDNIGNRTSSSRGTNAMTYTANCLNQYTQRTIPDGIDVLGSAETSTTVTVNNLATTRFAKYWYRALTGTNSSAADYHAVNVVGVYNPPGTNDPDIVTSATGHVFVAQTPKAFTYDDDGNLLSDGRFNYSWDAENRLIAAETATNLPSSVPRKKVEFEYDYMSRRVEKRVFIWQSNAWAHVETRENVFNRWNLLSEVVSKLEQTTTNVYVWGLDLSGTLSGVGGIGGLLAARYSTNEVVLSYDANGNVSELINAETGASLAHYEYDPYGSCIVSTGPLAKQNVYRFSTKPVEDNISLVMFEYRPYAPSLGRFLSIDPLGEKGGMNLFSYTQNQPISHVDRLGLNPKIKKPSDPVCCCNMRRFHFDTTECCNDNTTICKQQTLPCRIIIYLGHFFIDNSMDKVLLDTINIGAAERYAFVSCMQLTQNQLIRGDQQYPNSERLQEILFKDDNKYPSAKEQLDKEIIAAKDEADKMCVSSTSRGLCCKSVEVAVYAIPEDSDGEEWMRAHFNNYKNPIYTKTCDKQCEKRGGTWVTLEKH